MKWLEHLKTINMHKLTVMKHCFAVGLYKQGLMHDLSKYSWTEFSMGAKYFQGNRSPNDAEREDKGYTTAWLHHKEEINITLNIGLITVWINQRVWQGCRCRSSM